MRPGRAADHSPLSSTAVMEEKSYTSIHPLGETEPLTEKLYFTFTLNIPVLCGVPHCQITTASS